MARRTSTTHPDHGGRRRPTAAMVPHSRRRDIQQSANMLCDKSMSLKLENILFITIYLLFNGTAHRRLAVRCGPKRIHSSLESQGTASKIGRQVCRVLGGGVQFSLANHPSVVVI